MKTASLSVLTVLLALAPAMSRSQPPHIPPGKTHSPHQAGQPHFPVIAPPARPKDFHPAGSAFVEFAVGGGVAQGHKLHTNTQAADIPASRRNSPARYEPGGEAKAFEPVVPAAAVMSGAPTALPARKHGPVPECQ